MTTMHIPNARPQDEGELDILLSRAYSLAKKGEYDLALSLCDWLIEDPSTRVAGLRRRADVREHHGDVLLAAEDLEEVIKMVGDEPADLYSLGLLYMQGDQWVDAAHAFGKSLEICVRDQFDYYLNPSRMFRAESLLRINRPDEALRELEMLPVGYSVYVYGRGNRTREAMEAEALSMRS